MENLVLKQDIEELVLRNKYFEPFVNTSVFVTGSTGLIGSIIVKALVKYGNIKVYAACRFQKKFEKVFNEYFCNNLIPIFSDITEIDISILDIDYVIHGASITDSKTFIQKPVETIDTALDGTKNLLKQCIGKEIKGFVSLSSLEIYGSFDNSLELKNVKENDAGYIDVLSVRSSYSESKRMVENICKAYQVEFNIPIKICRLCQTFGAGVEYDDNRVFAQFARAIIENKNIILKTKGETVRNYCYTTDAVSGILTVLANGNIGEAYNIANMNTTISIADMAKLYCRFFPDSKCKVVFDISENPENLGYNPIVKLQLDATKAQTLGWNCNIGIDDMITRLVCGMKESK